MVWLENLLSQGTVERLGWMLVHFLWQAVVVTLALAAVLRLLRKSNANVRYLTACSALALMVVLPVATMQFIEVPGPAAEAGPEPAPSVRAAPLPPSTVVQVPEAIFTPSDVSLEVADVTTPVPWVERITSALEPALPYAVLGWLVGVFGLSAWHLGGWMQLQRLKRRMVRGVSAALQQRLAQIAGRLGVCRAVTLFESALVEVPTVVGWLRPVILLPASALTGLSPEQLEAILAHELAHIRRYDYLVNVLQTVVEILGFYHPAVWWVSHRIRIERENCCDDAAVRLCGDSVRYARALTCLEEIRHSQTELAMAATGGSLLDRIARLLGRPATDDRRFAWLPGLIALLLVVGIVIPTALTLGESLTDRSEPSSVAAPVLASEGQDQTEANEPSHTEFELHFVLAEVPADTVLDPQAAAEAAGLLTRIPSDGRRDRRAAPPTVQELQKPLGQVFSAFMLAPGKGKEFLDLLRDKVESAGALFSPKIRVPAGERASFAVGEMPGPNAHSALGVELGSLRLAVTANAVQDPNAARLDIDVTRKSPPSRPNDDSPQEMATWTTQSTLLARNGQYTSITDHAVKYVDGNGRERVALLLVNPVIVRQPEAILSLKARGPRSTEPNGPMGGVRRSVARAPNPTEDIEKPREPKQVMLDFVVAQIASDEKLDRDTAGRVRALLADAGAQGNTSEPSLEELQQPLSQVIDTYAARLDQAGDKIKVFTDLLISKGYAKVLINPRVATYEGQRARIVTGEDPNRDRSDASDATRSGGISLEVTPTIQTDPNTILLSMAFSLDNFILVDPIDGKPRVRADGAELRTSDTLRNNQCKLYPLHVAADPASTGVDVKTNMFLITVGAAIVDEHQTTSAEPNMPGTSVWTEVSREPNDAMAGEAQVAVEARIIEAADGTRLDRETMIRIMNILGKPLPLEGRASNPSVLRLTVGEVLREYVVQQPLSNETVKAIEELLVSKGYVKVLAGPKFVAQDGKQCQIKAVSNEYFWMGSSTDGSGQSTELQKVEVGTILDVTPHVEDPNTIFMEIKVELSDIVPGPRRIPPIISRRTVAAAVTTLSGQYVTLGGMSQAHMPDQTKDSKSVYIMAMPTLVKRPETNQGTEPSVVATAHKAQVLVECLVADVASKQKLDRKTADEAAKLLAEMTPKPTAKDLQRPLGEILQQYTENYALSGQPLEAFVDLLVSQGYARRLARPMLLTLNNQPAQVEVSEDIDTLDRMDTFNLTLAVTPKAQPEKDLVFLDLHLEAQREGPDEPQTQTPRRTAQTVVTSVLAKNGQSVAAPKTSSIAWNDKQGNERMLFTIVRPSIAPPPPVHQDSPGNQQVSLEVRTVAMQASDPVRDAKSIRQVLAQDGRETRIVAFGKDTPEQFPLDSPAIEKTSRLSAQDRIPDSGIVLSITPHTQGSGNITFDIAAEVNYLVRPAQRSDPPIVRQRTVKNTCTVSYGGTVLAASLMDDPTGFKDESRREVGVFVTAQVAGDDGAADPAEAKTPVLSASIRQKRMAAAPSNLAAPDAPELPVTATFTNADLRDVLAEISKRGRVSIAADETVKPQAVTAQLAGASVAESLRQILKGTPYVFKKIGEAATAKKEPPRLTNVFQGDELRLVLQDIAAMAGVTIITNETVVGPVYADMKDVPLETALEMVLAGKPYVIKKTPDYYLVGSRSRRIFEEPSNTSPWPQGTYLVYRPISLVFTGDKRRQALMDLAAIAELSIAVGGDVTGEVYADMRNVPLETAFQMLVAGTPYVAEKKADHYEVTATKTSAEPKAEAGKEEPTTPTDRSDSRAWTIMRQWNCPPLLLGLTPQFAKVLQPSRRDDPAWRPVPDGGTLRLDVEGDRPGEVLVGLFKDARWLDEPVAVRRLSGAGTHTLTGLPAGRYQIGAMIGNVPVPMALGVQRTWPEAVEIGPNYTATADVLVSDAFQKWASGWYNEEVAKDYLGQWADLDEANLLQGQLTGPDGKPIRFGEIQIREHKPGAYSFAAPNRGTDEQGIYKFDEMAWPYRVNAAWRETIPSVFGYRSQWIFLSRVLEGPQRLDFHFKPFPEGTAKVAGGVIDQDGQPVKGFFLRIYTPPFSDLDLSNAAGPDTTQVTYDVPFISEEGRFELGGLPAGRATVDIIPFEIQRYQHERGKGVILEADKTVRVGIELVGKNVLYGRVLFEDGTPAVISPAPWDEAATRILLMSGGRGSGVGEVGPDGYFTLHLDDNEMQALAQSNSRLTISVPADQYRHSDTAGEFPYEKLAEDKSKAGVVTVKRPLPTPTLPPALRQGGPLPQGWRLDYQQPTGPAQRRMTQVVLQVKSTRSNSQANRASSQERFELYGPDGKRATDFKLGSAFMLDKPQPYILIARPDANQAPDDWRLTRGPFTLDLSRPGQYTLTMDLSVTPSGQPSIDQGV